MRIRERGSVTVFFTAILIPTIILVSIFTDLSRIRFYNTQALMAADNYAEGVLTEYDNLLKELYGFFAVSQNEEGKAAIETIKKYMDSSFYVNKNSIEFGHLKRTMLNQPKTYESFQPYSGDESAFTLMDYEPVEGANLGNYKVLGNQIGDFMKFRIVKEALPGNDSDAELLDMIEEVKNAESKMELLKEKDKLDKKVQDLIELEKKYALEIFKLDDLDDFLVNKNKAFQVANKGYLKEFDIETKMWRYKSGISKLKEETKKDNKIFDEGMEGIFNSSEYKELLKPETSDSNGENKKDSKEDGATDVPEMKITKEDIKTFLEAYRTFFDKLGKDPNIYRVTTSNYKTVTDGIKKLSKVIIKSAGELSKELEALEIKADQEKDEEFKVNFKETLNLYKSLNKNIDEYGLMADVLVKAQKKVKEFGDQIGKMSNDLKNKEKEILNAIDSKGEIPTINFPPKPNYINFSKLDDAMRYNFNRLSDKFYFIKGVSGELLQQLRESFENKPEEDISETKESKAAKKKQGEVEKNLKKENDIPSNLRNIPNGVDIGSPAIINFDPGIFKDLYGFFKDGVVEGANQLWLKIYTLYYDTGMFSDRVDAHKHKENPSITKISMTGFDMSKLNYLYGAEMEYLCGGYKKSQSNLNSVRNKILVFRGIMNMISTFSIKELNVAINSASAVGGPFAALVNATLRLGFAIVETGADWGSLKEGKKVVLLKMKLDELEAIDAVKDWLPLKEEAKGMVSETKSKKKIEMNYKHCLAVIAFLFVSTEKLISRTGDLVSLNVNHHIVGGDFNELQFKMEDAHTAVKATSEVGMKFLLLPDGFGMSQSEGYEGLRDFTKATISKGTYLKMKEFEKNKYKYSIIRGY